ncbi:Eukaryotic_translation initiation factor 4E like protein [Hexamita inflata]|uniref:Eukaryotic translation initiation factor 4E like protein n=1 Tax=Hexamita inflata TaxID=28002 RepID=A0AA86PS11_9EUKA|nr:Eukaryotic translation initiation factor 4E like protein [Hexamita inflata]
MQQQAQQAVQAQPKAHALHNVWSVYFTEKVAKDATFTNTLTKVASFATVEQFAYVYSRLKRPSQLPAGTSVYFVREMLGSLPVWEHHINGGTYQFRRYTEKSAKVQRIDRTFERALFAVISEQLQKPIISAVQVTAKSDQCQISVWHFNAISKREFSRIQLKLGDIFESKVADFEYMTNIDSIKEKSTLRKGDVEQKPRQRQEKPKTAKTEENKTEVKVEEPKTEEKAAVETEVKEPKEPKPLLQIIVKDERKRDSRREPRKKNDNKKAEPKK